ncbi:MAG: tetratricopeptide repeat protein [Candidatus Lernaella stagnicola]|nr:tetratricopeptide repeat protein [Candidatus Lernaella stagnicola]
MTRWCAAMLVILLLAAAPAWAAGVPSLVGQGNKAYEGGDYETALAAYQQAAEMAPDRGELQVNLGNTLFMQGDHEGAIKAYNKSLTTEDTALRGRAYYNRSAAEIAMQNWDGAIESLRRSLLLNPEDEDAKHNLLYAVKKLEEQEDQEQDQQDQPDDQSKQDEQDEQDEQDQSEEDKQQGQSEKDKEQAKQDQATPEPPDEGKQAQTPKEQQQPLDPDMIDPELAAAILDALQQAEEEMLAAEMQQGSTDGGVDKDW